MTNRILVFGAVVLWGVVGGATTAQGSLSAPTYNTDTNFNLDVEWIWTLEEDETADPAAFTTPSGHWSIDLSFLTILPDGENGAGSATASLMHLTDFGSGAGGNVELTINFGVIGGIATSESESGSANHGAGIENAYTLSIAPVVGEDFTALLRITGEHPDDTVVPTPSAVMLSILGLGMARRFRGRRTSV